MDEAKAGGKLKNGCLIVLAALGGLFVLGLLLPEPTPEQLAERGAEQAAEEQAELDRAAADAKARIDTAVRVSSAELARAYAANEAAAQIEYQDKLLLVSGVVTDITLDFADDPVISLPGTDEFTDVNVALDDKRVAAGLAKGQSISVLCNSVSEVLGSPQLSECVLAE